MTTWFKKYNKNDEELYDLQEQLYHLSHAFYMTGNDMVGNKLSKITKTINNCRKEMRNSVIQSIDITYKNSQQNADTLLKVALSSSKIISQK